MSASDNLEHAINSTTDILLPFPAVQKTVLLADILTILYFEIILLYILTFFLLTKSNIKNPIVGSNAFLQN